MQSLEENHAPKHRWSHDASRPGLEQLEQVLGQGQPYNIIATTDALGPISTCLSSRKFGWWKANIVFDWMYKRNLDLTTQISKTIFRRLATTFYSRAVELRLRRLQSDRNKLNW